MRFIRLAFAAAVLVGAASPVLAEVAANAEKDSPLNTSSSDARDQRRN